MASCHRRLPVDTKSATENEKLPPITIFGIATRRVQQLQIQKAMLKLMEGKTCFVIAHRLSTIENADLILVVNDGEVVEQGTHRELMERGGVYRKLYNAQFE